MVAFQHTNEQGSTDRPLVGIRVDATTRIGSGHATRCIAIAEALADLGCDVVFIVSCEESTTPFMEHGFSCEIIDADEQHLGVADADALYSLCASLGIKHLLLDSYGASTTFMERFVELFAGKMRTAFIDDMYSYESGPFEKPRCYGFDIVIGGDVFFEESAYQEAYQGEDTELLIGPRYIPIRSDLHVPDGPSDPEVKRLMITTGSTNPGGILERMSRLALDAVKGTAIEVHVVVGPKASFDGDAQGLHLHQGEPIVDVMRQSQVAFSSAGITLLELIALGMPTLAIGIVDNQQSTVDDFKSSHLGLGCIRSESDDHIGRQLRLLVEDGAMRTAFSERCRSMIDGKGAERIARRLLDYPMDMIRED